MRKILLAFLFILFFAGLATLVFGFYNARKIRHFSTTAGALIAKYEGALEIKEAEKDYQKSGTRDALQLKIESDRFIAILDEMKTKAESARREVGDLNVPLTETDIRKEMTDFYSKAGAQIQDAKNISEFMNKVFQVAVIFGKIKQDIALDEMKILIAEAKNENSKVDTSSLPQNIEASGQNLKQATDIFLAEMERVAGGAIENSDQLNAAYDAFSSAVNEFSAVSRGFINSAEDLSPLQEKIRLDISSLQKIYFKIK